MMPKCLVRRYVRRLGYCSAPKGGHRRWKWAGWSGGCAVATPEWRTLSPLGPWVLPAKEERGKERLNEGVKERRGVGATVQRVVAVVLLLLLGKGWVGECEETVDDEERVRTAPAAR